MPDAFPNVLYPCASLGVGSELPIGHCSGSSSCFRSADAERAAIGAEEPVEGAPRSPVVIGPDPGPIARLEHVKSLPDTAGVVFQRLCDGESLQQIARAWGLPKGAFVLWFMEEHSDLFDKALKVLAADAAHDAMKISDTPQVGVIRKVKADGSVEVTEEDMLGHRRLQVDTRLKLASKWDRKRYGEEADAVRTVPVVIQIANLRGAPLEVQGPGAPVLEGPPPK